MLFWRFCNCVFFFFLGPAETRGRWSRWSWESAGVLVAPALTRIEKGKWKERQQSRGFLLELDTALTQLVNLPKACGTSITRARVTAYSLSNGCHSGSDRKRARTVGSVKRRRSQGKAANWKKKSWRRQQGNESERVKIRHSRKRVERGEGGSAHRPRELARVCPRSSLACTSSWTSGEPHRTSASSSANRGPNS